MILYDSGSKKAVQFHRTAIQLENRPVKPVSNQTVIEHVEISLQTPSGEITTAVGVPTSFVPITAILPLMRGLGEEAQALEQRRLLEAGKAVSCQKGCAACCRMLVPISAPEALALARTIDRLDQKERNRLLAQLDLAHQRLAKAELLKQLTSLADSENPVTDEAIEPLNRAYYALRMPCPFLENEVCSIYEDRPAACRELAVTSPATECQDMTNATIQPVPVAVRISTTLSLLWADLTGTVPKLIPLPLAVSWAARHQAEQAGKWAGTELLEKALDKIARYLSQEKARRSNS